MLDKISNEQNKVKEFLICVRTNLIKEGVIHAEDNYHLWGLFRKLEADIIKFLQEWKIKEAEEFVKTEVEKWYKSRETKKMWKI